MKIERKSMKKYIVEYVNEIDKLKTIDNKTIEQHLIKINHLVITYFVYY